MAARKKTAASRGERASSKRTAAKGAKAKRAPTKRAATRRTEAGREAFPDRIFAIASPRSVGGVSMFEVGSVINSSTVGNFASDPDTVQRAVYMLQDAGFEVLQANNVMINIAG